MLEAPSFADPEPLNGREINLSADELTDRDMALLLSEHSGVEIEHTAPPEQQDGRRHSPSLLHI